MDWSADDQRILIRKSISAAQSQLLVLELATGELTPLKAEAADGRCTCGARITDVAR